MSIKSTSLVIIAAFAISAFGHAQQQKAVKGDTPVNSSPFATRSCFATFNTALPNFCVTENGNIENFSYPAGYSQIYTDGYGVCDFTNNISYYDVGVADSGNWQNPVVTQPGGVNTFPLTIKRMTSDGIWTITQAFSRSTADAYVKVVITLKNNTAVTHHAWMTRYVDIDADAKTATNYFDGSTNSGWGYESGVSYPNHGLTIQSKQSVHNYFGFASGSGVYDPCTFSSNGTPFQGDGAVNYLWIPNGNDAVGAGKSITVTLEYRPM